MIELNTTSHHDNGYDLVRGWDITASIVGAVSLDDGGLVLRLYGSLDDLQDMMFCPDTVEEAVSMLCACGYTLGAASVEDIADLITQGESE